MSLDFVKSQADALYSQGQVLLGDRRFQDATRLFAQALQLNETSQLWCSWAISQQGLEALDEAAAGFARAFDLDASNALALQALNESGRVCRPLQPYLDIIDAHVGTSGAFNDADEESYFKTHRQRYAMTLRLTPEAESHSRILELGMAFQHLAGALIWSKGYRHFRGSDMWNGASSKRVISVSPDASQQHPFTVDNFDFQNQCWPYATGSFDVVLCCELLEHLNCDPMILMSEMNRVLTHSGRLLMTTPNISCAKAVACILRGHSPYVYGSFEVDGRPTDRHNREYTIDEVRVLMRASGFTIIRLETHDSWWPGHKGVLRLLASLGLPVANRGDNIFCLAQKVSSVVDRYPAELYLKAGTQRSRLKREENAAE